MHGQLMAFALLLLIGLSAGSAGSEEMPLEPVHDTLFADFLTRSERIFGWDRRTELELYRISEGPLACDGTPESCPRQRLFVRVYAPEENRNGYLLPPSFGWKDPRIVHGGYPGTGFTVIEVQEKVIGTDPEVRWFDTRTRRIYVGEDEAYIQ